MSTTTVLAAATDSVSSVTKDPVPPLLVPQCSSSSLGSSGSEDREEEVLAGLDEQCWRGWMNRTPLCPPRGLVRRVRTLKRF